MGILQTLSQKQRCCSARQSAMQRSCVRLPLPCDSLSYHLRKSTGEMLAKTQGWFGHIDIEASGSERSLLWSMNVPHQRSAKPYTTPPEAPNLDCRAVSASLQLPDASYPWHLLLQHSLRDLVSRASSYCLLIFHGVSFLIYSSNSVTNSKFCSHH